MGIVFVSQIQDTGIVKPTFNIEVADYHTYFVGRAGVWVHNCDRKAPKPGISGKEGAKDIPSWLRGERPFRNETGRDFAKRVMDEKYGPGNYSKGPGSEYNKIQKWADRSFQ